MATACVVLVATARAGVAGLVQAMREAMVGAAKATALSAFAKAGLEVAVVTLALPAGALLVVACLVGVMQTRGLAAALPLMPEARRVLPSLDKVLGRERAIEAGKGVVVVWFLFTVAFWSIRPAISAIAALGGASAAQILRAMGVLGEHLAIRLIVAMLALGAADFLWQRHHHGKALRMSRDEVKREHKESEGEPAQKAERLRLHQEIMQEQALGDVTKADFVVVHAGFMAAAIRYDRASASAPVVMMKGERRVAQAIEAAARAAGVPVIVDPNLSRALASVDDGGEIPKSLYEQVAECLVRVQAKGQFEN
jgi:flagellar biosynthesis protein FlhB